MKIRAQDIKPGHKLRTSIGSIITVETVNVFDEKRSAIVPAGAPQAYLPGCVFITWAKNQCYAFQIDEEVERVFVFE